MAGVRISAGSFKKGNPTKSELQERVQIETTYTKLVAEEKLVQQREEQSAENDPSPAGLSTPPS